MKSDPITGRTIRFTFTDGPLARKTFEHVFGADGTVTFRTVGGDANSTARRNATGDPNRNAPRYEVAMIREDVGAVSYLGSGGYTLTTVLDFKTRTLVAFSSNEKQVSVQHGTFEDGAGAPGRAPSAHVHG